MCENYKPPRAHHCRQCNRCIPLFYPSLISLTLLQMRFEDGCVQGIILIRFLMDSVIDHHCPWINNCVGHCNYASFIRFLFYVDVACSYHIVMVTKKVLQVVEMGYWVSSLNFCWFPLDTFDQGWPEYLGSRHDYIELCCMRPGPSCSRRLQVRLSLTHITCTHEFISLYHFYCLIGNTTTIEGWEKDKVSLMVKRGKLQEVWLIMCIRLLYTHISPR